MPKLKELGKMDISVVNMWIVSAPHSDYYRVNSNDIPKYLDYGEAVRYLAKLVVDN